MKSSRLLSVLLSLSLALFFLTAAIAVPILCRPYYYRQIDALELPAQTGWSEQVIREAYDDVMDYLVFRAPFDTGSLRWSESGRAHFADCRALFQLNFLLLAVSALTLLAFLAVRLWRRRPFHAFLGRSPFFWSAVTLAAVFSLAALWALIDFTSLFTAFHTLFFPGKSNWIFSSQSDQIILILPEIFWAKTGALILILSLSGACAAAGIASRFRCKKHETTSG